MMGRLRHLPALCILYSSTRCTHPEQSRGTLPAKSAQTCLGRKRRCVACCNSCHAPPTEGLLLCPYIGNSTPTPAPRPHPLQARVPQNRPPCEPGCTYKVVRAVRALHSAGSVPFRLLLYSCLQVGRARTSGGGMHALHDTARGDAQAAPTQLCSTAAALCTRGTSPLPARWV
jgi:hypothetical protein